MATPNRQQRWIATVALAPLCAAAVGGCSATASAPQSTVAASSEQTATTAAYASIVAPYTTDADTTEEQITQCAQIGFSSPGCEKGKEAAILSARNLHRELRAASTVGEKTYIGPPPGEISTLVAETEAAALVLPIQCVREMNSKAARTMCSLSISTYIKQLNKWRPYGA